MKNVFLSLIKMMVMMLVEEVNLAHLGGRGGHTVMLRIRKQFHLQSS